MGNVGYNAQPPNSNLLLKNDLDACKLSLKNITNELNQCNSHNNNINNKLETCTRNLNHCKTKDNNISPINKKKLNYEPSSGLLCGHYDNINKVFVRNDCSLSKPNDMFQPTVIPTKMLASKNNPFSCINDKTKNLNFAMLKHEPNYTPENKGTEKNPNNVWGQISCNNVIPAVQPQPIIKNNNSLQRKPIIDNNNSSRFKPIIKNNKTPVMM
tara:strand:+ start:13839 stop:14477 length:639 start_codon:yes stop_codon:yes gene_type:complete